MGHHHARDAEMLVSGMAVTGLVAAPVASTGLVPAPPVSFNCLSRVGPSHVHMRAAEDLRHLPWWRRQLSGQPCGTLILLRHGETEVPRGTSFVGWSDPDLNKLGEEGTAEAARAIMEAGYTFDVAYTSVLIVGIGSLLFHGTLLRAGQVLDEVPMLWASLAFLYALGE